MLGKGCSIMVVAHNNNDDKELELARFADYLLAKRLAPEKNAKFYVQ